MNPSLSFIIPVRHHENSANWNDTITYLKQTIASIANQTDDDWNCLIVTNNTSTLPDFAHEKIIHIGVDFEPNKLHDMGSASQEEIYDSFRYDKGRRALAALNSGLVGEYYMIVDDDDFVHQDLSSFVRKNESAGGWYVKDGYIWGDGGNLLMKFEDYHRKCGSSHIIKYDAYDFTTFSDEETKKMLGSHMFAKIDLAERGIPLEPLPFLGGVYRIGHRNSHSRTKSFLRQFYLNKKMLVQPIVLIKRILNIRMVTSRIRKEFKLEK